MVCFNCISNYLDKKLLVEVKKFIVGCIYELGVRGIVYGTKKKVVGIMLAYCQTAAQASKYEFK